MIDLHTHKCTVYELNIPFIPAGIPQNATFLNTVSIGDSGILGEGVNIDNWQGAIPNVGEWMGSVTSKGECYFRSLCHFVTLSTLSNTLYQ